MAPEERVYCGDPWCDGDHYMSGQRCDTPVSVDPYDLSQSA